MTVDRMDVGMESEMIFTADPEKLTVFVEGKISMPKEAWQAMTIDDNTAMMLFFHNLYSRLRLAGFSRSELKRQVNKADEGTERYKRGLLKEYEVGLRVQLAEREAKKREEEKEE